jgi:hypothetical protein
VSTTSSRRRFLLDAAAGLSSLALASAASAQPVGEAAPRLAPREDAVTEPVAIAVNAQPIAGLEPRDRTRVRFGALEFRSGLVLTSSFRGFGGLSSLRLDARGERFLALSDHGVWFTGRIRHDGRAMVGLDEVEAAPVLGADGRPITDNPLWYDTEALARDGDLVYVGLERVNQIMRFDFARGGVRSRGEPIAVPPGLRKLPNNKGVEALVVVPRAAGGGKTAAQPLAGTLIAFSERGLDADGNLSAFLIGGPTPGSFSVRRTDKFDISDAVLLPSGRLLILERKFSWFTGVNIRIRALALTSIAPNAVVDGPSLFEADLGQEIDNMEGIDAHVGPEGETVLTLVSDDNFSPLQRTLLLQFTLVE